MTNSSQGFNDDATGTEASDTSDDYDYDLDGNMTKDENKDITLIKYNHLNLPTEIQFTNNRTINYTYDATGVKKQKQVFDGTYTTITDYIDGYQYENKHINLGGRGYTHLLFFPHAEGYVKPVYSENKTLTTRLFSYVYNHTDHLGNIRVSYAKVDGVIEVLEENHYYPFGLKHQNYNDNKKKLSLKVSNNEKQVTSTVENPYKYKHGGKELQEEFDLNLYDYGARNYDASLGRWMSIDNQAELYVGFSTYHYSANNPIYFKDVDGNYFVGTDGKRVATDIAKDGSIKLGSNASSELKFLVNTVNYSGSNSAVRQILKIGGNKSRVNVKLENDVHDKPGQSGYGLLGSHRPHDKNGNPLKWDNNKDDFAGVPVYLEGEEGVYKEVDLIIFKGNIEKSGGNYRNLLTIIQEIARVFQHEAHHNTDKEFITDLRNKREGKKNNGIDPHQNIRPQDSKVIDEIINRKQKPCIGCYAPGQGPLDFEDKKHK